MINPIHPVLQKLLSEEFSGHKHRKYDYSQMVTLIRQKFDEAGLLPEERHVFAFMKHISRSNTTLSVLEAISNEVLGDGL